MAIRALSRFIHGCMSQWRIGRIDAAYREREWVLRRGLATERRKFNASMELIGFLKRDAAHARATIPWAGPMIVDLLRERLRELPDVARRAHSKGEQNEDKLDGAA